MRKHKESSKNAIKLKLIIFCLQSKFIKQIWIICFKILIELMGVYLKVLSSAQNPPPQYWIKLKGGGVSLAFVF